MSKPWYKKNWLAIALLVLLPPIGIVLTWLTDWRRQRKVIATGLGLLWWLIVAAGTGDPETSPQVERSQNNSDQTESVAEESPNAGDEASDASETEPPAVESQKEESSVAAGSGNTIEEEQISHPPEGYSLSVKSQKLDGNRVLLELTTNIPGTIKLMAGISLSGQAPDETWIGKNERVRLVNGTGQVMFDVNDLPAGEYDVEATFYPQWGFQDDESRLSGVKEQLEDKHSISLTGSGEPAELAAQRNENQKWVMENVFMGMEWEPDLWSSRFGEWEEFPVTTLNPDVISNYYFETLDMTLVVNTRKNEIVTWRMGRDGL